MNRASKYHQQAMELAEQGDLAQRRKATAQAKRFFQRAFYLEREAALYYQKQINTEPTRSVLFRSAASLAMQCGQYSDARTLIEDALRGDPPEETKQELHDLLVELTEPSRTKISSTIERKSTKPKQFAFEPTQSFAFPVGEGSKLEYLNFQIATIDAAVSALVRKLDQQGVVGRVRSNNPELRRLIILRRPIRNRLRAILKSPENKVLDVAAPKDGTHQGDSLTTAVRLHKTVTIYRDGYVRIDCRYGFIVHEVHRGGDLEFPHQIWRTHERLPDFLRMLRSDATETDREPFLRFRIVRCSWRNPAELEWKWGPPRSIFDGFEISYPIWIKAEKGLRNATLEYEVSWGYPHAFLDLLTLAKDSEKFRYNSVGLRAGNRGPIGEAVLELRFERNWVRGEENPIFDSPPTVSFNHASATPHGMLPKEFWHSERHWNGEYTIQRDDQASNSEFEVYRHVERELSGQMRVIWQPSGNYHRKVLRNTKSSSKASAQIKQGR